MVPLFLVAETARLTYNEPYRTVPMQHTIVKTNGEMQSVEYLFGGGRDRCRFALHVAGALKHALVQPVTPAGRIGQFERAAEVRLGFGIAMHGGEMFGQGEMFLGLLRREFERLAKSLERFLPSIQAPERISRSG